MSDILAVADVTVRALAMQPHLLLHCEPHDAPPLAARLSLDLPETMLRSATARGWSALHLAPDEWLLVGPEADRAALAAAFVDAGRETALSLVDISDRSLAFAIDGPAAEILLAAGCPMDLAEPAFPVGACTRTMLGKAMVMLWRTGPAAFRLEVARSFADYVTALLTLAATEPR